MDYKNIGCQIYWKGKEIEPHILNTFVRHGLKNSKFYKECFSSLAVLTTKEFSNIHPKPNISPIAKFHQIFKCL